MHEGLDLMGAGHGHLLQQGHQLRVPVQYEGVL